ncbi:amino acid ABC transporter permease [Kocuria coralli]|uniref:Amino acid ABC transporter permease n=1 Tax=Kocuria coralli TaxID=1461025 RepID=A0A5J5L111_9MICC|nr:amino acid ABC transporter permease [Kocuria coralli]KAA9395533.1 amino acid ABC transporter permease [Kocuria coralli]
MSSYFADFASLFEQFDVFQAFWVNIQLTFFAAIGSMLLGTVLALMRVSPIASMRWLGAGYVNIIRNTPLTIILVFLVLGVWSQLQINLSSDFNQNFFRYAVIGLAIYHAAFVCEAIRSGVNTVPVGQAEAARAIGLGFLPSARLIIFPQALRGAITPLGNTLIALTKNTTVAAAASVTEISALMKSMIEFRPDVIIAVFLTVAIGFVLIVVPVGLLTTWASRKFAVVR